MADSSEPRLPARVEVTGLIRAVEAAGGFATVIAAGERDAGCISASLAIARTEKVSLSSGMTLKSPTTTVGCSASSSSWSRARSRSIQAIL